MNKNYPVSTKNNLREVVRQTFKGGQMNESESLPSLDDLVNRNSSQKFEWIRVGDLFIDPDYQRSVSMIHVNQMVKNFDWDLFSTVGVNRRKDGTLAVFDGQHRVEAVKEKFGHQEMVPAVVLNGLSAIEEAKMFYSLQTTRKQVTAYERFRAQLFRGEPGPYKISEIAERHGYAIAGWSGPSILGAVSTLENIAYGNGSSMDADRERKLDWTLRICVRVWQHRDAVISPTLGCIAAIYGAAKSIRDGIDEDRLVSKLGMHTPQAWLSHAKDRRVSMFVLVADQYNSRLSPARRIKIGGEE